jgi:hypothetical protein
MRRSLALGVCLLLSATLSSATERRYGDKGTKAPNYYPLQVGNTWHFKVTVMGQTITAISRIAKIETIDNVALARLEASIMDNIVASEHLRVTEEGVFRYRSNGQEFSPPLCFLKYPVKPGAKWEGEYKVGNETTKYLAETQEETVEVPAGKFKAIKVTMRLESMGQVVHTSYWFVPDVGFVKQTVDAKGPNIVMELEKYELKK